MTKVPARLPAWVPLPLAAAFFLAMTGALLSSALARTGGAFVYAQDDPYIHLAMGRTLAQSGVWGIHPSEYAFASSAPLWTLILAALQAAGATAVWWPFAVNVAAGLLLLAIVDRVVRQAHVGDGLQPVPIIPAGPRALLLLALVAAAPLPTLAFVGMEHVLQAALLVALAAGAIGRVASPSDRGWWPGGAAIAAAATGLRYESLFVVAALGLFALLRRRPRLLLSLGLGAAVPVVAYALYAVAHGGLVLPNSILMKSGATRFASMATALSVLLDWIGVFGFYLRPPQLVLTLASLAALAAAARHPGRAWAPGTLWLALFVIVSIEHVCLVKIEWFYRYEAYLVVLGLTALSLGGAELHAAGWRWPARSAPPVVRAAVVALAVLMGIPLAARAVSSSAATPAAVENVHDQQVQLARFFAAFYPGETVAVNDIGAVAWQGNVRVLDLAGLASQEVTFAYRHASFGTRLMERLVEARNVPVIAFYDYVFTGPAAPPEGWVKVGEWEIERAVAVADETVSFYAPSAADADRLRAALDAFASSLPDRVKDRRFSVYR